MPKVHNWEDWDEAEEWVKREQSRIKTNGKVNEKNKKEKNNVEQKTMKLKGTRYKNMIWNKYQKYAE